MGYVHRSPLSIAEAVRRKSLPDATQTKRRYGSSYSHTTTQILDVLRRTVWPNHNWAVIYLILFAFFMASVPWHYFVSKKAIGYPASICLMLGIVGVTATSIYFVGARGYDERASVHMIAYAKQLDPGRFEVRRHGNVFVTSSGRYTLRFRGAGGEFTCGAAGTSLGEMSRDGSIRVPIPVFTSRPFFHVAVVDASLVEVKVRSWLSEATRDRLSGLSLELDRDVVAAWAFHEDQATRFEKVDDRTIKAGEVILSAELFFNNEGDQAAWRWTANETPFDELCIQQSLPVLADRWRSPKDHRLPQSLTGPDTVRIAVLCRMPDELKLVGQDLMNQEGYVLYDVLLQRPE